MQLKVVIADDEASAREHLRSLLEAEPDIDLVAECADGRSTVQAIQAFHPDLVFLDIQMPELNGFDVLRSLAPGTVPAIVIVSAHQDHALEAFNIRAADYLLKPFDRTRFQRALELGRETTARRESERPRKNPQPDSGVTAPGGMLSGRVAIRSAGNILLLPVAEIDWIEGARNYARIHSGKKVLLFRETLTALSKRLPNHFLRISRSAFVNLHRVREMRAKSHGDAVLLLDDGTRLTATRNFRDRVKRSLTAP